MRVRFIHFAVRKSLACLVRTGFYCKPNAACSFVWVAAVGIFQTHNVVVMIMCLQSVKFQLEL